MTVTFSADTGAYFVGSLKGRNKLCPAISKGKTIEGALGGLALSFISALFFWFFVKGPIALGLLLLISLIICIAGQIGDLVESVVKRAYGLKDSGSILPGHGGLWDRMDSIFLAGASLYWLVKPFFL